MDELVAVGLAGIIGLIIIALALAGAVLITVSALQIAWSSGDLTRVTGIILALTLLAASYTGIGLWLQKTGRI